MPDDDLSPFADDGAGRSWTRRFSYTAGSYAFSGEQLPYYSATLTVREALRELTLAHQLPVDPDDPVHLDELMQRILDDERAAGEILAYLKRPNHIKFFNSLTVVLLPTDPNGRAQAHFGEPSGWPPDVDPVDQRWVTRRAGGVLVREAALAPGIGQLMWQPDVVRAVIIDGQHRFLALSKLMTDQPDILSPDESKLPILFIAPTIELGFAPPPGAPNTIVATSRAIFTDVNKNAKKVSTERQYLLDDGSLAAVAMRRLLTDGIGGTNAQQADEVPARIPLAIVDWTRPDRSRFDDNEYPFITTIRTLHQLVSQTIPATPGAQEWNAWRTWIARVDELLAPEPPWSRHDMIARVQIAEDEETQFSVRADEIEAAASSYADARGQVVALPLLRLQPYHVMVEQLRSTGLLGGQAELWLGQDTRGRAGYASRFGDDGLQAQASDAARSVKDGSLGYQVVFQRAFVTAALEVDEARSALVAHWQLTNGDRSSVLLAWIDRFNRIVAPRLRDRDYWRGTAITPSGDTDYVLTPLRGVTGLVLLLTIEDWTSLESEVPASARALLERRYPIVESLADEDEGVTESAAQHGLRLVDDDPWDPGVSDAALRGAARWEALLADVRPGPAPDPVAALLRLATRYYRDSLRRYARALHQAVTGLAPEVETEEAMVRALGARRLATAAVDFSSLPHASSGH